jgi:putative phage-type endonuclease
MTAKAEGLTKEQKRARRFGVGASEVGAILGLDPYTAALDVFSEKVGLVDEKSGPEGEKEEKQYLRMGRRIESVLLDEYEHEMACDVQRGVGTLVHPVNPWALCSPDALVPVEVKRGVECKNRHWRNRDGWGPAGSDEVPASVFAQCAWSMFVVDVDRWDVVAYLGGDFRVYHIHRDRELEENLVERVRVFWEEHVQKQRAPSLTENPDAGKRYLSRLFPQSLDATLVKADAKHDELLHQYASYKVLERDAEKQAKQVEVQLLAAIGQHAGIVCKDGLRLTWTSVKESRVEAHTRAGYRRPFLYQPKKETKGS